MPIGVRTPVDSMSMRFLIGIVQMLGMPGKRSCASISSCSSSKVMRSGAMRRADRLQRLRPVASTSARPCAIRDSGLSSTVVSTIENGAGSVGVSARPALPKTRSTSGKSQHAVLDLQDALRLGDRHAGQRGRHVEEVALVERRHELRAELEVGRHRSWRPAPARRPASATRWRSTQRHDRLVEPEQDAADRMALLGIVRADDRRR